MFMREEQSLSASWKLDFLQGHAKEHLGPDDRFTPPFHISYTHYH